MEGESGVQALINMSAQRRMAIRDTAQVVFNYLAVRDELEKADIIIGFGHFDAKIPRYCCELYSEGYGPRILFTGGIGGGTADLGKPEGIYFAEEARRLDPAIPDDAIIVESASTNTSENILNSIEVLRRMSPASSFDQGIGKAIIVANAYRQRRVWLACRKKLPSIRFVNSPPETTFECELEMFAQKGQDLTELLVGEIERIVRYGELGYIERELVPEDVHTHYLGICQRLGLQVSGCRNLKPVSCNC